jgi:GTP-binding protein
VGFSHLPKQPKGGPDGGDGGKGGDVFLEASENYHSLEHLHKETFLKAEDGKSGGKNKKHGKNGKDLIISVPIGTTVYRTDRKDPLADLISPGEKVKVAEGGNGGKGNINFATSTNQAPRIATPGKEGKTKNIKLIFSPKADVVVIGPPNSGKSSLIGHITGNSLEIASYPFTTKKPHLWTYLNGFSRYSFMDTPPLVPEAAEDIKILLRRAKILLVVLDSTESESFEKVKPLLKDIEKYFEKDPSRLIAYVLAKIDWAESPPDISTSYSVFPVSVEKDEGIEELKGFLFGSANLG